MTEKELLDGAINFIKVMENNRYSELIAEQAMTFLTVIPQKDKDWALKEFTKIAKEEPDEKKFHLKISDILREKLGYPPRKTTNQIQENNESFLRRLRKNQAKSIHTRRLQASRT